MQLRRKQCAMMRRRWEAVDERERAQGRYGGDGASCMHSNMAVYVRVNARPAYSLREEVQILGVCETLHKLELHLESSVFGCRPCAISLHACCRVSCAVPLTSHDSCQT
jgi:hypothetical protein